MVRCRTRRLAASLCLALALAAGPAGALAQEVTGTSGDWEYGADAAMVAASTSNAQGWMFGLLCSPDCIGFIEHDQPCEVGRRYGGRMRVTGRDDPVPLECRRLEARYVLLFTPTEAFVTALSAGPELVVSVRLGGQTDTEFRFSLNGAYDAVYYTLATALAASNAAPPPSPESAEPDSPGI